MISSLFCLSRERTEKFRFDRDCKLDCVPAYHKPLREISTMNRKQLEAFAKEAAKTLKTEKDLSDFSHMLKKITV